MKKLFSTIIIIAMLGFIPKHNSAQCNFFLPDFSNFNLVGSAHSTGNGSYQLTNYFGQYSAAWYRDSADLTYDFDVSFNTNQCGGADGMAFVLQSCSNGINALGGGGSNLGYYNETGSFTHSLAVELDIYPNLSDINVVRDGLFAPLVNTVSVSPHLANCANRILRLTWDATTHVFSVYFDGVLQTSYTNDLVADVFAGNPHIYFGFTGATGNDYSIQSFSINYLHYQPSQENSSATTAAITYNSQCPGGTLTANPGGAAYLWSTGATTNSITGATIGTYTVTVTDQGGCTQSASYMVNSAPGDPSVFGDHTWNVYAWNAGDGTDDGHSWIDSYSGYYVEPNLSFNTTDRWNGNTAPSSASGYQGCPVANDNHSWSAKRHGFSCGNYQINILNHNQEAQLFVNGVNVWEHTGSGDMHHNVWSGFLDDSSNIEFRCSAGQGFSSGNIEIKSADVITPNSSTTICPGYSLLLTAGPSESYLWNTGQTTQSITVSEPGNYSVDVITNGCTKTLSQSVNEAPLDTPAIYPNPLILCSSTEMYIDSNSRYASVLWNNGTASYYNNATATGAVSVTVTDGLGCSATSHGIVTKLVNEADFGNNVWKVNAYNQGFYSYYDQTGRAWYPDDYAGYYIDSTLSFNSADKWADGYLSYPSTAEGYIGCDITNNIYSWSARRQGFPCGGYQIDVAGYDGDAEILVDGVKVWDSNNGGIYWGWIGVLNADSKVEFRVTSWDYSSGAIAFTLLETPISINVSGHSILCAGQSYTLSSPRQGTCLWSTGETTNTIQAGSSGSYSVVVTDQTGCSITSQPVSLTIHANTPPVAHITASSTSICNGNPPITLSSDSASGNLWSNGAITQNTSVSFGGNFFLKVTNSVGCYDSTSIHLNVGFTPATPSASNGGVACEGSSATLTASGLAPGGQVASFNGLNQQIEVTQNIPETNFTIEMWVKTTAANCGIFSVNSGILGNGGHDRHLFLKNGQLTIRTFNGNAWASGVMIGDGTWHHIALVVQTGVGQKIYVDGNLAPKSSLYDHSDFYWQTKFNIGYSVDASQPYFNGQIDNVRIWSEARSQADIRNNMSLETPLTSTNLVYQGSLNGNLNAAVGNNGTAPNGISYTTPDYYTYTWTGAGAPIPSTSEIQTFTASSSGTYSVIASAGDCTPSASSSTELTVTPATHYYPDADGDDFGSSSATVLLACTNPGAGYVTDHTDCNDGDESVNPSATEICNSIDDNCNSQIDEGVKTTFYADADGDGYGNASSTTQACSAPSGYVTNSTDCNDASAGVHPGATEVCNSLDDNCDGIIDEGVKATFYADADGDSYGNISATTQACSAPSGYVSNSTDCDDASASVHPGATEVCNSVDDDCDVSIDEGVKTTFYADADGDGYGNASSTTQACSAPSGYVTNSTDCNDANTSVHPGATEVCNSVDDNCNSQIDEGVKTTFYRDADGDSYGNSAITTTACSAPSGYVSNNTDCNDGNANVNPVKTEICNNVDDNCNSQIDEGVKTIFYRDADNDGYGNPNVTTQACSKPSGYVTNNTDCDDTKSGVHPGVTDICNSIDDNCNGQIDENGITATLTPTGTVSFCDGGNITLTANSGTGLMYQWMKNGVNISGATKKTYTANASGSYQVKETKTNGCSATSVATAVNNISSPTATITPQSNLNICQTGSVVLQANTGTGFIYQWLKGSTNISGATNSSYKATAKGTYKVIVTNSSNCSKTSAGVTVTKSCKVGDEGYNGSEELIAGTLNIYPNPTTGIFVIDLNLANDDNEEVTIQLYNSIGQLVQQEKTTSTDGMVKQEMSLASDAPGGLYLIRIIAGEEVYTKQLIVQE